jgi:hypothetical protein
MVSSKDLRIGNLVMYDTGEIGAVVALTGYEIAITQDRELIHQDCYSGIPITPEWLEDKCGWTPNYMGKSGAFFSYNLNDKLWLYFTLETKQIKLMLLNYGIVDSFDIKYIHQLQNLTHSITGNELPIK